MGFQSVSGFAQRLACFRTAEVRGGFASKAACVLLWFSAKLSITALAFSSMSLSITPLAFSSMSLEVSLASEAAEGRDGSLAALWGFSAARGVAQGAISLTTAEAAAIAALGGLAGESMPRGS